MQPSVELPDIRSLVLAKGSHRKREDGYCLLEAVSFFAGEPFSDSPKCVDLALAAFGRSFNDRLRDDERQQLCDLVPRLVGTAGSRALAQRRAYLLVDRYLRSILPAFFRELPHRPRADVAERLEALTEVVDTKTALAARDAMRLVRDELQRDRAAAWAALTPAQRSAYAAYAAYAGYAAVATAAAAYAADAADADAAYAAAAAYDADAAAAAADAVAAAAAAYAVAAYDAAYAVAAAAAAAAAYAADAVAAAAAAYAVAAYDAAYAVAAAAAAAAAAYAAALKDLRGRTIHRSIASFVEAIELTESTAP